MSDKNVLKVLLLEDNPGDVELIKHELLESDINFDLRHVFTKIEFLRELDEYMPDIILADYTIPNFSGTEALSLVKELSPETPLIIVTGTIDEETAVNCMKAGAVDYVLKSSLQRISSAIKSGLEKRKLNKEKRKIEDELIFSMNVLESLPDATIVINTNGEINYWNKSAENMFGYLKHQVFNERIMFFESKQERDNFLVNISNLNDKKEYQSDELVFHKNGNSFWVLIKALALFNKNNIMIGFLCSISDISERKLKEIEYHSYQDKSKIIFSSFPDIVVRINKDMIILDTRIPTHLEFLQPPKDLNGKSIYDLTKEYNFISKELLSQFNYYALVTFKTGYIQLFETKFILFQNLYNFEIRLSLIDNNDILVIIRDITGQEHTKNEINTINYINGTIQHNIDGKITYISQELIKLLGYQSEEDLLNVIKVKELYSNIEIYENILSTTIINEIANLETKFKTKNGKEIPINLNARMIKDKIKNNVSFELIINYKKESQSNENKIKYHQDIETLSILVSDIAYELNSISSSLSMNTYILKNELNIAEKSLIKDHIDDMEHLINSIPKISNKLLNFNQVLRSDR